jgi:hypothetical protein
MFDWKINVLPDNGAEYGLIDAEDNGGGIGGAVCRVPDVPSTTWRGRTREQGHRGQVMVFVEVPDVEAALVQAEALGGTRMMGPDEVRPGVQMGKFTDPAGHLMGVVSGG